MVVADAHIPIEKIDGWIAMSGDEHDLISDLEVAVRILDHEGAVLIRRAGVFDIRSTEDLQEA